LWKTPLEEFADKPEKTVSWALDHSVYGEITITDEGSQHWRQATTKDTGIIVLVNGYDGCYFGELDDIEDESIR